MPINGTSGDDLLNGTAGDDDIRGKSGDDTLFGLAGNDELDGGSGDDELHGGDGDDTLDGSSGRDTLFGDAGDDELDGGSMEDVLDGGDGNDVIDAGSGDDTVDGGAGNDDIDAGSGDDNVDGGAGNDTIDAGSGDDVVDGGAGDDLIDGRSGDDTLTGGEGDDTLEGGSGDDVAVFAGSIADFALSTSGSSLIVEDTNAGDGDQGTDTLDDDIEILQFDDFTLDLENNNASVALVRDQVTDEDSTLGFVLTVVDFEGDDVTLDAISVTGTGSISVVGAPSPGTTGLGSATDFSILFDPGSGYQSLAIGESATETVTVTTSDDNGASLTQTFEIVINGVNDAPVIDAVTGDGGTVTEDGTQTATGAVLASDIDASDILSYAVQGSGIGTYGTMTIDGSGNWTYTLDNNAPMVQMLGANTVVSESFVLEVSDGNGGSDSVSVSVNIQGANDDPVIDALTGDGGTVTEDGTQTATGAVLASDIDIGDILSYAVQGSGIGTYGTMTIDGSGNWTYTLDNNAPMVQMLGANTVVSESFVLEVSDGNGGSDSVSVSVNIQGANDDPTAQDDAVSTDEDNSTNIAVLANDSDPDTGDALTVTDAADPANGSVVVEADNTITYTPDADFFGEDSFTYTISDGNGGTDTATVTVTVNAVNDAPVSQDQPVTLDEADGIAIINLRDQVVDPDGDALTFSNIAIVRDETIIPITVIGDGIIRIDPEALGLDEGESLSTILRYDVEDPSGASDSGIVPVTILGRDEAPPPANSPPVASELSLAADEEDGLITIAMSDFVSDPDEGDTVSITSMTVTRLGSTFPVVFGGGILSGEGGEVTIDPTQFPLIEEGDQETLVISYSVVDSGGLTAGNTITIDLIGHTETGNIAPIANDLPTGGGIPGPEPDTIIVDDPGTLTQVIDLSALVSDPDGPDENLVITPGDFVIGFDETSGTPITVPYAFDPATGLLTLTFADLGLADGESVRGELTYSVSDGIDSASGQVVFDYVDPMEPAGPISVVLDFEPFDSPVDSQINISDGTYEGFSFFGSAVVIETDEVGGGRGETGVTRGQTTPGGDNVLVGSSTTLEVPVLDPETGEPIRDPETGDILTETVLDELFGIVGPGTTIGLGENGQFLGSLPNGSPPPSVPEDLPEGFGDDFDLDGLSLNLPLGGTATVFVTTYTVGVVGIVNASFPSVTDYFLQLVELDTFEFDADSETVAELLDFNDAAFSDDAGNTNAAGFDDIFAVTFETDSGVAVVLDDVLITV